MDDIKKYISGKIEASQEELKKMSTRSAMYNYTKGVIDTCRDILNNMNDIESRGRETTTEVKPMDVPKPSSEESTSIEVEGTASLLNVKIADKDKVYAGAIKTGANIYSMQNGKIGGIVGRANINMTRSLLIFKGEVNNFAPVEMIKKMSPHIFIDGSTIALVLSEIKNDDSTFRVIL